MFRQKRLFKIETANEIPLADVGCQKQKNKGKETT